MIESDFEGSKKILVTGGSGFIGVNLTKYLSEKGFEVLNFDLHAPLDPSQIRLWRKVDILDIDELEKEIFDFSPNFVFHLAARTDLIGRTIEDYSVNFVGTKNLIAALAKLKRPVRKTTYFSSRLVFETGYMPRTVVDYYPTTPYGESKVAMEKIIFESGDLAGHWSIVRPTSIWGPWFETPYRDFYDQIYHNRFFKVAGHNPTKSFGYVGNLVVYATAIGVLQPYLATSTASWLCDSKPIKLNDWADLISSSLGKRKARTMPYFVLKSVALIGDTLAQKIWRGFPLTSFRLKNMLTDMEYDTSHLESIKSEDLATLEQSVDITSLWYLHNRG
jgi:nucleoside-diphosphate-sugar epimerase